MGDTTAIEWTDRTWNPATGCTKISAGCDNCYAETIAERFRGHAAFPHGFDVQIRPDKVNAPLSWRKPARVFVNSMSDLFHADIVAVMATARQHTFQLLTKRHARMRSLFNDPAFIENVRRLTEGKQRAKKLPVQWQWPLPNLWLGVSVENQQWADIRIPALLDTPAKVRFLSCEPLLGPVNVTRYVWEEPSALVGDWERGIDWVIVGGESGRKARPMAPQWATSLRDQCTAAQVPFFFKQWGEYAPTGYLVIGGTSRGAILTGDPVDDLGHRVEIARVGKKNAGRELDGRTWDQFPTAA